MPIYYNCCPFSIAGFLVLKGVAFCSCVLPLESGTSVSDVRNLKGGGPGAGLNAARSVLEGGLGDELFCTTRSSSISSLPSRVFSLADTIEISRFIVACHTNVCANQQVATFVCVRLVEHYCQFRSCGIKTGRLDNGECIGACNARQSCGIHLANINLVSACPGSSSGLLEIKRHCGDGTACHFPQQVAGNDTFGSCSLGVCIHTIERNMRVIVCSVIHGECLLCPCPYEAEQGE